VSTGAGLPLRLEKIVSKLGFNDAYLFLDRVIDANALEDHTFKHGLLFDKGDNALPKHDGDAVALADNLLAVDDYRPGGFYGDRSGRGWLFCNGGRRDARVRMLKRWRGRGGITSCRAPLAD
jgi:hypothetical protein